MINTLENISGKFRGVIEEFPPGNGARERLIADAEVMLFAIFDGIMSRYRRKENYKFIDTKFSMLTGREYDITDPIAGKDVIYSWIQGRGLESLAGYEEWVLNNGRISETLKKELSGRINLIVAEGGGQMEAIRQANGGKLFFIMTPGGQALEYKTNQMVPKTSWTQGANFSDLFYAKGLARAAWSLGDKQKFQEACDWFKRICENILAGHFYSDQQGFDPKNLVGNAAGRYSHASRMIALGGLAMLLKYTGDEFYKETGLLFIEQILSKYVNVTGTNESCERFEMWEFVDRDDKPWVENNVLISDPGHANEFVGLALKFIKVCETAGDLSEAEVVKINSFKQVLPEVLKSSFKNGFSKDMYGIIKHYDLISKTPINTDMPWWSLPETMRAAVLAATCVASQERQAFCKMALKCSNAFFKYYVRKDLHCMATQILKSNGEAGKAIPAVPDIDPGYHTGLSIIDSLEALRAMRPC